MGVNDELYDQVIGHSLDISRFGEDAAAKSLTFLYLLGEDLRITLSQFDAKMIDRRSLKSRRVQELLRSTEATINKYYKKSQDFTAGTLRELASMEADFVSKMLPEVLRGGLGVASISPELLKALTKDTMIQGSPASAWWAKQAADTQFRFANQVRLGMATGDTTDAIVRRVLGQGTWSWTTVDGQRERVRVYTGGVLDSSYREATALVRTAVQTVANEARNEMYLANGDVIKGRMAVVTLDGRTTPLCRSRSGAVWDMEGNPLPESLVKIPFPGPPPWHYNCRTTLSPVTYSWKELIERYSSDPSLAKRLDGWEPEPATQSSMNGQVPAELTYSQWLKKQPASVQRDILGPSRYELWKSGKADLTDMVDLRGRQLNLAQLRARINSN